MCTCRFNYVCWRPWRSADLAEVSLHQITTAMFSRTISDTGTCFFTRRSIVVVHQLPRVSLLVCLFAHMKWQATRCEIIVCTRRGVWCGRTRESRSHVMPCYWCHPTNCHYEVVHALDYVRILAMKRITTTDVDIYAVGTSRPGLASDSCLFVYK